MRGFAATAGQHVDRMVNLLTGNVERLGGLDLLGYMYYNCVIQRSMQCPHLSGTKRKPGRTRPSTR